MPAFVNKPENVEGISFDLVVAEVRKRPALATGKSMWPGMIAAFPLNDHAHRFIHPFVKIFAQSLRKFRVVRLRGTLGSAMR